VIKWKKIIFLIQILIIEWNNEVMMQITSREHQHQDQVEAMVQENRWGQRPEDLDLHIVGAWTRWLWRGRWWWTWVLPSTDLTQVLLPSLSIFQPWLSRDLTLMHSRILVLIILTENRKLRTFSLVHHINTSDNPLIIDNLTVHMGNRDTMDWQIVPLG